MAVLPPSEPLERVLADACLGARPPPATSDELRAFLRTRGVSDADAEAICAAPPRLFVYRSLVRNSLSSVVLRMLPRTRARMNAVCAGRFDADLAEFVASVSPRTHYLRDVPFELFAWARARWAQDPSVPAYLVDLAAYELTQFEVASAPGVPGDEPGEVAFDRPVAFHESVRMVRVGWAVHELADDDPARELPAARPVVLLACRDEEHGVRWLELSRLAAAIVERLRAGEPLGAAVARACADAGTAPASVVEDVARLLSDLADRGAVLGSTDPH